MTEPVRSRRGVYYDLEKSPYRYESPYGDLFKFSSQKKLDIYTRDISKELDRVRKLIERHDLGEFIPDEIVGLIQRAVYKAFYRKVEG